MFSINLTERVKKKQKKRSRSTICTIPITSVKKDVIKDKIIKKLITTIKQKLTRYTSTIIIQLDGYSYHNIEKYIDINRELPTGYTFSK